MPAPTMLAGFFKWEAPGGTVRLCDGGTLVFDSERYNTKDLTFGALSGFETISEGVGDEAPAGMLTFSPAANANPEDFNGPALQGSRIRMWIGEIDRDTGLLVGDPDLQLDSLVDVTRLKLARGKRALEVDIVSRAERLFLLMEGNVLSGEFHRRIYASETGLDNALGVPTVVAWGVVGAPRGTASYTGGFAGGGGGGGVTEGGGSAYQLKMAEMYG